MERILTFVSGSIAVYSPLNYRAKWHRCEKDSNLYYLTFGQGFSLNYHTINFPTKKDCLFLAASDSFIILISSCFYFIRGPSVPIYCSGILSHVLTLGSHCDIFLNCFKCCKKVIIFLFLKARTKASPSPLALTSVYRKS